MKKIILFLLIGSVVQVAKPMENSLVVISEAPQVEDTSPIYINSALLTSQVLSLAFLKYKNYLFSHPLPKEIIIRGYTIFKTDIAILAFLITFPMIVSKSGLICDKNGSNCEILKGDYIKLSEMGCAVMHLLNLFYNDLLAEREKLPVSIKSKIKFDKRFLSKQICGMCRNIPDKDCINPCDKDHIYCTKCFNEWLSSTNSVAIQDKLKCPFCRKEITVENQKVEIIGRGEQSNKQKIKQFIKTITSPLRAIFLAALLYKFYEITSNL